MQVAHSTINRSTNNRSELISRLKSEVCALEGYSNRYSSEVEKGKLGLIERAFPKSQFPLGVVHEFISDGRENAAATNGFLVALLSSIIAQDKVCIWVSNKRTVFPPALKAFGIAPDRVIFIDLTKEKDVLWVVEEALKCNALAAVVGEMTGLSFTESRRLQLAVENSHVTGFIHRYSPKQANTVACATRWKVQQISSTVVDGLPGLGYAKWEVQLLKVRNGKPSSWRVEWSTNAFQFDIAHIIPIHMPQLYKTALHG